MSEVKRYLAGDIYDGAEVVHASDFDNVTRLFLDAAERAVASERREKELQQSLTAADEREDVLTTALTRIHDRCQSFIEDEWTMSVESTEVIRDIAAKALLKAADAAKCCAVSAEDRALLQAGDYTPEELFGVGGKPSCPKCAKPAEGGGDES